MREHTSNAVGKAEIVNCPNCGSNRVETERLTDRFLYGTGATAVELSATIPFRKCAECGFEFTDAEAEDVRHEAICRHLGVMTPLEVARVRHQYDMTRAVFAEKSRIGEASLARWESGQLIQNAANDNYLYLLSFRDNMERLQWRRSCDQIPTTEPAARNPTCRFRELTETSSTPQQRGFLRARRAAACT